MFLKSLSKILSPQIIRKCHSVFDFKELLQPEKVENFTIHPLTSGHHEVAVDVIKRHYLPEHVFVRARRMDRDDRALDEYLTSLLRQGNGLFAKSEDGTIAGVCINFASSAVDPKNLRYYASYRQDENVKNFLYFIAKLQETPNLWEAFHQKKIFEIKMLTVLPEFRRQGLAVSLVERSKEHAMDQGYKVIRMDCINPYDYKIAERCMLQCVSRVPLRALHPASKADAGAAATRRVARVYVAAPSRPDLPERCVQLRQQDLDSLVE